MNFYIIDLIGLQNSFLSQDWDLYGKFFSYYYLHINISILVITVDISNIQIPKISKYLKSVIEYTLSKII